jgi:uncharacterized membrane protein
MMSGSGGGTALLVVVILLIFVLVAVGAVGFALWHHYTIPGGSRPRPSPADLLRERYARGEISREQYRQALLDLLQDRYVRGEIGLEQLEERSARVLSDQPRTATAFRASC